MLWQLEDDDLVDFIRECTPYLPANQYFDETPPHLDVDIYDDDDDDDDDDYDYLS